MGAACQERAGGVKLGVPERSRHSDSRYEGPELQVSVTSSENPGTERSLSPPAPLRPTQAHSRISETQEGGTA